MKTLNRQFRIESKELDLWSVSLLTKLHSSQNQVTASWKLHFTIGKNHDDMQVLNNEKDAQDFSLSQLKWKVIK